MLFSYLLGSDKRRAKAFLYRDILNKYGVSSADEIPMAVSKSRLLKKEAEEAYERLLAFVRYAAPGASSPADCDAAIRTVESMVKEYRNL